MHKNLFILPNGTEIFSGVGKVPAVASVTHTRSVNTSTDLDLACAFSAFVEATLIDTSGAFTLAAGDELEYYEVDSTGNRTLVGHFLMEAPTKPSANTYKFTAYDRMILLDKDLTDWLTALNGWPYTMRDLLFMACAECGLEIADGVELINGDYPVQQFLRQVTGRQIVQWAAGANAAYAYITPEGQLSFGIYTDAGELALPVKSLKLTDYTTAPIERVAVKQDEDDVGVSWPENSAGETYAVLDNPLLATFTTDGVLSHVENIANRVIGISYTPAEIQAFDPEGLCRPGVFLTVADRYGKQYKTAVFSVTRCGGISTLKSTGNAERTTSTAAVTKDDIKIIQGRVTRVKRELEEVSAALSQTVITTESVRKEQSALVQTVSGISASVSATEQTVSDLQAQATAVALKADSLDISVTALEEKVEESQGQVNEITEHFIFSADGLTIANSATGMGIGISEERVIFTGGEDPTTVITPNEMQTTNLRVGEQLDIGEFSFIPRSNGNLSFRYTGG